MRLKLTKSQWAVCCIIAVCVMIVHVAATQFLIYLSGAPRGSRFSDTPDWIYNAIVWFVALPLMDERMVLLNTLIWGTVSALIYVFYCHRKPAA
jgi:hypothetical protein